VVFIPGKYLKPYMMFAGKKGTTDRIQNIIEQVAWNRLSLLPNIQIKKTQTLQLFTKMIIKWKVF
jgi:hypothetical protein